MGKSRVRAWILLLGVATSLPAGARAQLTVEQEGSVLVFPKVIADATTDTVIQIANQSTGTVHAHCLYASPASPSGSAAPVGNFQLALTATQPTHWVASRGRPVDPNDSPCTVLSHPVDCNGAGFDPGPVPALPSGFHGELLCIETDVFGTPISANDLIGKATLEQLTTGDLVTYNAIGVPGLDTNNGDDVLCLGGGVSDACPEGAEYAACPQTWLLNHLAEGAEDPVAGDGSTVSTSLTVVPCSQDFVGQNPQPITLQFVTTNELEQTFTASATVEGWAEVSLAAISPVFARAALGTDYAQTRIAPASSSAGFMLLAQTTRESGGADMLTTSTVLNLQMQGAESVPEIIVVPTPTAQ